MSVAVPIMGEGDRVVAAINVGAPTTRATAEEMIERVKGLAMVRGYRGLAHGDVRALAQAVAALSRLALVSGRPVAEAEINPLIVKREGVVAVDGLVVMKE